MKRWNAYDWFIATMIAGIVGALLLSAWLHRADAAEPELRFEPQHSPKAVPAKPAEKVPNHSPDVTKKVVPPPESRHESRQSVGTYPQVPTKGNNRDNPVTIDKTGIWLRVYSYPECGPCNHFHRWYTENASSIGCDVEQLKFDNADIALKRFPTGFPRFELYRKGTLLGVRTGWKEGSHDPGILCPDCLRSWVQEASGRPVIKFDNEKELKVAAKPIRVPFRTQVQQAFDVLRQAKISTFSLKFHSNDGKRVIRVAGKGKVTPDLLMVCGAAGRVEFDAPGSLLPNGKLYFGYRIYSNTRVGIDVDEVVFDFGGTPKAGSASGEKCGFAPLTILSAVVTIMQLFSAHCDLELPADTWLAGKFGDSLDANFTKGNPVLSARHLWSTEAQAAHFNVTTSIAALDLKGWDMISGWFLPRRFNLQFD